MSDSTANPPQSPKKRNSNDISVIEEFVKDTTSDSLKKVKTLVKDDDDDDNGPVIEADKVWIVEIHRLVCGDDQVTDIEVFASEKDAKFYLANYTCDDIESIWSCRDIVYSFSKEAREKLIALNCIDNEKIKVHKHIRGDLDAVTKIIEEIDEDKEKSTRSLYHVITRSRIYPNYVGQALAKYTIPEPERTYGFDCFALGLKEISSEMHMYSAQLDHPDQEVSNQDMMTSMLDHVERLKSMLTYQNWLIVTGTAEEMAHFDIKGALRMAQAIVSDIEKSNAKHASTA